MEDRDTCKKRASKSVSVLNIVGKLAKVVHVDLLFEPEGIEDGLWRSVGGHFPFRIQIQGQPGQRESSSVLHLDHVGFLKLHRDRDHILSHLPTTSHAEPQTVQWPY